MKIKIKKRPTNPTFIGTLSGFTLLELLVVMVIIGLLVSYVGLKYFSQLVKSEVKLAKAQMSALEKAFYTYHLVVGQYPLTEQRLDALFNQPANEPKWQWPYLKKTVPLDAWGQYYFYKNPGEHGDIDIVYLGANRQPGGTNDVSDIGNW